MKYHNGPRRSDARERQSLLKKCGAQDSLPKQCVDYLIGVCLKQPNALEVARYVDAASGALVTTVDGDSLLYRPAGGGCSYRLRLHIDRGSRAEETRFRVLAKK